MTCDEIRDVLSEHVTAEADERSEAIAAELLARKVAFDVAG